MPQLDDDSIYADRPNDNLSGAPSATQELRQASIAAIVRGVRRPGATVVKITRIGTVQDTVQGYVTMGRYIEGATPRQCEKILGLRTGALADGCLVYTIDASRITADNIAPRAFTNWPDGISPRELENQSRQAGFQKQYHPNYPPATDSIPQFEILSPVPARLKQVLGPGQRYNRT